MSDNAYRVFFEARKGEPLVDGEFEALYSRVEAAWIAQVEAAIREQVARDLIDRPGPSRRAHRDPMWVTGYDTAMIEAARIVRGEQP